jgi:hypothetical protein
MTPENLKERAELEKTWETEEEQRAAIMKKMRWDHARMGVHERRCRELYEGEPYLALFISLWVTLATAAGLFYHLQPDVFFKHGIWIFIILLWFAPAFLPTGIIRVWAWIYKEVLKRPVFLPTRARSEAAEIEKVRSDVDGATNRIYWAQSDLRRYVSPWWIRKAKAEAEDALAEVSRGLEYLAEIEKEAENWQWELLRRYSGKWPSGARRISKDQRNRAQIGEKWYEKHNAQRDLIAKLHASWLGEDHTPVQRAHPLSPSALAAVAPAAAPPTTPVKMSKDVLGAILERGPIIGRKEPDAPQFPLVTDEFIPPAGFRYCVEPEPDYPVADAGFTPPAGFRIQVEPVPVDQQLPTHEFATGPELIFKLEPKAVRVFEPEPEPEPVVEYVPEPEHPEPAPVFETMEKSMPLPPISLPLTRQAPDLVIQTPARAIRTPGRLTKPEPEYDPEPGLEGRRRLRTNYTVVRNPKLRAMAVQIHGRSCCVCSFNFDAFFGPELAKGYIEIHHLTKIADGERSTDPSTDLAPLCANCHAMADRLTLNLATPPASIADLKRLLIPPKHTGEVLALPDNSDG